MHLAVHDGRTDKKIFVFMVLIRLFRFTYTSVVCYRYHFSPPSCKVVERILEGVFENLHNSSMQKYVESCGQSLTCFSLFGHHQGVIRQRKRKAKHWLIMTWMRSCSFKKQTLKLYKVIKTDSLYIQEACIMELIIWMEISIVECLLRFQGYVPLSSVVVYVPLDGWAVGINSLKSSYCAGHG